MVLRIYQKEILIKKKLINSHKTKIIKIIITYNNHNSISSNSSSNNNNSNLYNNLPNFIGFKIKEGIQMRI